MKVLRIDDVNKEDSSSAPIFFGGLVTRQDLVTEGGGADFNCSVVNFDAGARNKFHKHTSDQILLVTSGTGVVATEAAEFRVSEGAAIHIPAGEKHWHGATPDTAFSHITITAAGSQTEIID